MTIGDVLVSHVDLDGYGCAILARRYLKDLKAEYHVNYDELAVTLMDIPRDVHLYLTDLSIPENLAGLIEEFSDVTIIDHHVSTYWVRKRYSASGRIDFKVTKRRCATYLFGEYLVEHRMATMCEWLGSWMELVDDYDRYVKKYDESDRLNSLLYISNRDRFVDDAQERTPMQMLADNAERIDRYIQGRDDYVARTNYFEIWGDEERQKGNPVMFLAFAERYKSKVAEHAYTNLGADLVMVLDMRTLQGSLRSTKASCIDCAKLASMIDPEGGGHLNASGFSIPEGFVDVGLEAVLPVQPSEVPRYDPKMNEEDDEDDDEAEEIKS